MSNIGKAGNKYRGNFLAVKDKQRVKRIATRPSAIVNLKNLKNPESFLCFKKKRIAKMASGRTNGELFIERTIG